MDTEGLQTVSGAGGTDVNSTTDRTTKGGVNRGGPIGGNRDNSVRAGLETVHQGKELRDDTSRSFDFIVGPLSLGRDRVDFFNEENGGLIFLSPLECLVLLVSCATIQYFAESVSVAILDSTVRMPPRTREVSPLQTGRYTVKARSLRYTAAQKESRIANSFEEVKVKPSPLRPSIEWSKGRT